MTPLVTWLLYPSARQILLPNAGLVVARLRLLGVQLLSLDDGVLAATGPCAWFSEENRQRLRERTCCLCRWLRRRTTARPRHCLAAESGAEGKGEP